MSTSKLKLFAFIIFLLIVGVSWASFTQKQHSTDMRTYADVPDSTTPIPTLIIPEAIETEFMDSPDGVKTLTMEHQEKGNDMKYSFFVTQSPDASREFVYAKELSSARNMSIPYNTWSPDNKYFFLKESALAKNNYYIFFASGENFPNNSQYVNIQTLFEEKVEDYTITDVTGWADPKLLIVNTQENDEDKKVSFWFDVPSQSFIRLGTYFY